MKAIFLFLAVLLASLAPLAAHNPDREGKRVTKQAAPGEIAKVVGLAFENVKVTGSYSLKWDSKTETMQFMGPMRLTIDDWTIWTEDKDARLEYDFAKGVKTSRGKWMMEGPAKR